MYNAIIAKIEKVYLHPNADKIQLAIILNSQVVVGLDAKEGDIVVYFESDGQLSEEYAKANDLIAYTNEAGEKKGGYFDKNRRIRCQKFRGEKSEAYCSSIESLTFTGYDITKLKVGDRFDTLNGIKICNKYITENTKKAQSIKTNKKKESQFHKHFKQHVRNLFPEHIETNQWRHYSDSVEKGSLITITHKLHGTCLINQTKIIMEDGSTKNINKVKIGDCVLGYREGKVVKSKVLTVFDNGTNKTSWLNFKFSRIGCGHGNTFGAIICTPEHPIYSFSKEAYIEAQNITQGEEVGLLLADKNLYTTYRQLIIGKLLGDGHLLQNDTSAKIEFSHKKDHIDYIHWMLCNLGDLANPKLSYRTSGYGTEMVRAATRYNKFIKYEFGDWINKNSIPERIIKEIDPLALAVWYMDDGSLAHNDSQEDRACIAICSISEDKLYIIEKIFEKFGITPVFYYALKYWRLRLNKDEASKFFELICSYVPEVMQYKLPKEYRGRYKEISCLKSQTDYIIKKVKFIEKKYICPKKIKSKKWDIETETHNFFANGLLVHNSGRISYIPVPIKLNFFQKVLNKLFFGGREHHNYKHIQGTRRVIKYNYGDGEGDGGYYGADAFRDKISDSIKTAMNKNEIIYFEIVGYTDTGSPIMGSVDTTKLKDKEFTKRFGQTMTYKYGCLQGECEAYVYRIAVVNPDGITEELPWDKVKRRCREMGINHVPEIATFIFNGDKENLKAYIDKLTDAEDIADSIDASHIREGICIRIDKPNGKMEVLKSKTFHFRVLEGIIKDSGVADAEEAEDIKTEEISNEN